MPFRFKVSDDSWEAGFRRIAGAHLDETLDLIRANELPPGRIVHQTRRSCKAMRGLIRLVRPDFPAYKAENRIFRDISKGLASARDSAVLIRTLDHLLADNPKVASAAIMTLREQLVRESEIADEDVTELMKGAEEALLAARVRVAGWYLTGHGEELILKGLQRTYRESREAMQSVGSGAAVAQASHDWRKQVKYHWQHMRLLRSLLPDNAKRRLKRLDRLGDLLGERHDLDMLVARLETADAPVVRPLIDIANHRAANLTRKAGRAGKTLFAEEPSAFIERWRKDLHKLG